MKQALLDSLKNLPVKEASSLIEEAGHETMIVENGVAIALLAYPNTVVIWLNADDVVTTANAGDPLELE